MFGMIVLFGYIHGLEPNATGHRNGPVAKAVGFLLHQHHVPQLTYVALGGLLVVGMMLTKNLLSAGVNFALNRFLMKLNERVAKRLFEGYLLARYEVFSRRGTSKPANNISRIFELFSACFGAAAQVMSDGATLIMIAILLLFADPMLTVGSAVIFGTAGIALYFGTQRRLIQMGREEGVAARSASQFLGEGFKGLIDGRLNNTRGFFVGNYLGALRKTSLIRRRKVALSRLPQALNEVLLAASIVCAVLYLTLRGSGLHEALPLLAIFGFAGMRMTGAMSRISKSLQVIRNKVEEFDFFTGAVHEVAPDLWWGRERQMPPESYLFEERPLPAGVDGRLHRELELQGISFAYPEGKGDVVRGVSLSIPRGSFVSFCGPSGGGKTTLVLLLMGLMKPQSGHIRCDGWSVFEHIRKWHSNIGYVGQNLNILARPVRENVGFGLAPEQIDDEKVWRALELASAADFVRALPDGINTNLRESGSMLSGGQKQRIAIARALYKDPDILFFDEATAALDNVTEREITNAITRLSGEKTIICVAHRLSTIRSSDTIYLIEKGRVSASGTYEDLLVKSDSFRAMAEADRRPAVSNKAG
jgi:ATP-binding cassette subfamily C protein